MKFLQNIDIEDYNYPLPEDSIAKYPLQQRDESSLLIYKDKLLSKDVFYNINSYLPERSLLVFNNTKVIQARLHFKKPTGAEIEIFCLEPYPASTNYEAVFQQRTQCKWRCLVGNAKKWKAGVLENCFNINGNDIVFKAEIESKEGNSYIIQFSWDSEQITFSEILEYSGLTPLPPYIKRAAEPSDKERYQTVYARNKGSVAAPTAGLHFTEKLISQIKNKNIDLAYVSLHVGAGTFIPVSENNIINHIMHTEQIVIKRNTIIELMRNDFIIPVGTTSVRTIESLYWFGLKLMDDNNIIEFKIEQWDAYSLNDKYKGVSKNEALKKVIDWMNRYDTDELTGSTQMIIVPGYEFKLTKAMITNFHQPKSTLLLLVSAFIGTRWKEIYEFALENNFRFLSYGDSCLFIP